MNAECNDTAFGPAVLSATCRGGFDLTVTFEESIMSMVPSACFLLAVAFQTARVLKRKSVAVKPSLLLTAKLAAITLYVSLQLVLIVLWSTSSYPTARISVASSTLELCSALGLGVISPLEHRKSPRPSFVIACYLAISLLLDLVRVRTAWLIGHIDAVAATLTASIAAKLLVLILEATDKRHILIDTHRHLSSEATSGFFGRGFFWWLNSLLKHGSRQILSIGDLSSIHEKLASDKLAAELSVEWDKCNQKRKHSLALATLQAWRCEALKIAVPRLLLVAFRLAQPFIIEWVVENISGPNNHDTRSKGFGLIGAVAVVYFAIAVFTGSYQHLVYRLMTMTRGGLIALIYQKLTESPTPSNDAHDAAVMTLIGTDVERICETWYLVVAEIWPSIVQLGIAVWFLQRQLGAVCVAPVILALVTTGLSLKAATYVSARQRIWLEAIEDRVNFTAHVLSHMKVAKMLGLSEKLQDLIQGMRVRELELSKRFRRLSSFNVCLSNLPSIICQLITFAAFTIVIKIQGGGPLGLSQAISSLSILTLLMSPLEMLLYAIPQAYAALGCFERIQVFLSSDSWKDVRQPCLRQSCETTHKSGKTEILSPLRFVEATFGWQESQPVVRCASLRATRNTQLIFILGPVGCGKSTLLKGILGETLILGGTVWVVSKEVAFCNQSPWISNGTIRDCIIGPSEFETDWYDVVIQACALDVDLQQLPSGDATRVGSKGVSLSGGQKQRLEIARVLYSRKQIAIFDDVVSGLDAITRSVVMMRVFGPSGLLRRLGTTTILATHMVDRLEMADLIVVLDEQGRMIEQGPPNSFPPSDHRIKDILGSPPNETTFQSSAPSAERSPEQTHDQSASTQQDRQIGDIAIYKYYFSSLGWLSFFIFGLFVVLNTAFESMQYAWLTLWSQSNEKYGDVRTAYWLGLYALFAAIRVVSLITAVYYLYVVIVPRSAQNLHLVVLRTAMRAPMGFILRTDTGTLINRFSQDMQLVDLSLPGALVNTSYRFAGCLGVAALAIVALPYFAAVIPLMAGVLYFLQRFYLRTSRQLRLLELESKAPLYSHVLETIDGMISIALVNLMTFGESLAGLITVWTELETSLGAVSRVKTFSEDTAQEVDPGERPPSGWPAQGSLTFDNWSASYHEYANTPRIKITASILPGQKVAVCGRTGSGKSSLISSVLGMVNGSGGRIVLDGIDLSTLPRDDIRKNVTCVTQDPFLFSGSVRLNLDPLAESSDDEMRASLERVALWTTLQRGAGDDELTAARALDSEMNDLRLSHGQAQLFCLARAMLRKSPLIMLDEPTSSVDATTESEIQKIVAMELQNSTVIMVTHRLSGISAFDRVAVLDQGVMVEYGPPDELLAIRNGALAKLCEARRDGPWK
ncbi:ABC transporter domain-containing protein [Hirsutella rhossiliensis]|uniref:ABC transporter domain-containing protein n=1 Tax=Hirsutella rhossiliensis TaxID=111463 RepID=A0A9P8MKL9_9HYPO|nr:ABC transporter domain-containing protein [Hirsutella rhossiliensis]KAH0958048.1 ABC transporter domain-containing protein [Hirsutella rhossiliensis]